MPLAKERKYIIWESCPDLSSAVEELRQEYPDMSDDELLRLATEDNNDMLETEKSNLKHIVPENGILAIADLGLWNGRKTGVLPAKNEPRSVPDCLKSYVSGQADQTFYVNGYGEFKCAETHHDGTNYYIFRAWKQGVTDEQKETLRAKIYSGKAYASALSRLTYRLGDEIGDVYGWFFTHRPQNKTLKKGD